MKKAYTLAEILIVLLTFGTIAAMIVPTLIKYKDVELQTQTNTCEYVYVCK